MTDRFPASGDVRAAAAQWYARMTSDAKTPEDTRHFDRWIAASAAHSQAYLELSSIADQAGALAGDPAIAALRAEARALTGRAPSTRFFSRPMLIGASGLAAIAAAIVFAMISATQIDTPHWSTEPGERSEVVLADGSHVTAGSDTRFAFAAETSRRALALEHGRIFLDVTHDSARPFIVTAGDRTVTVRGTAFDVLVDDKDMTVTLVRGRIDIARKGEEGSSVVTLVPGQRFTLERGVVSIESIDAEAATSWRNGVLDFDDISLAEAVDAFNGNSARALRISDPALRDLRISGVFRTGDADAFAAALAVLYPVRASADASGDILITSAN